MRDLKNKLISSKNTKNIQTRKGKSFGYQVLGFGAGASGAAPYAADFLVIAGGGGGGNDTGSGAGAGGYRNSFSSETSGGGGSSETSLTLTPATSYTITIGGGGAAGVSGANNRWCRS